MANLVAALTGAMANMAAIETEFQANWDTLDFMRGSSRGNVVVRTNLAAGQTMRLLVRAPHSTAAGAPVWYAHQDGAYTIPAKVTTDSSDWAARLFVVGEEYSGFVVWASTACTVSLSSSDLP